MLTLTRPLVFFDLETTGLDIFNDRIVQLAVVKLHPDGTEESKEWLINPGVPIPAGVTAVHGITDEMVQNAPSLGDLATELVSIFSDVNLGGYNIKNFDVPMLREEFNRVGILLDIENVKMIDAMRIFQIKEPRTLAAAYQKYCGKELVEAHHAMADVRASIEVLEGEMNMYSDLPKDVETMHELCFPKDPDAYDAEGKLKFVNGQLTINFGKNRGKSLQLLAVEDSRYLEWILTGSFSEKVKQAIRKVLGY